MIGRRYSKAFSSGVNGTMISSSRNSNNNASLNITNARSSHKFSSLTCLSSFSTLSSASSTSFFIKSTLSNSFGLSYFHSLQNHLSLKSPKISFSSSFNFPRFFSSSSSSSTSKTNAQINLVKELRKLTSAGYGDCKQALEETGNNIQKAIEWLKEKGKATATKRVQNITAGYFKKYLF